MEASTIRTAPAAPRTAPLALRGAAPAGPVRLATFALLVAFGLQHWVDQVQPSGRWPALAAIALSLAISAGWLVLRRAGRPHLGWALGGAAVPLALLASGMPARLLLPDGWDDLAAGVGQGLAALPNTSIPYKGVDEWIRADILAGGVLLAVIGAVLAFNPAKGGRGHPLAAAVALSTLWVVPVVERNPDHPYLDGAAFALLLGAFLWADRLRREHVRLAAALMAGAVLAALAVTPQLDRQDPWVDLEALADRLAPPPPSSFDWNHSYDPLDWPREGEEVLRIKARQPAYWKATTLDTFDGVRWVEERADQVSPTDTEFAGRRAWEQELRVVVKAVRSRQFLTAGYAREIRGWSKPVNPGPGGTKVTATRPLRPGDSYLARVYTPRPSRRELQGAGATYPPYTDPGRRIVLPLGVPGAVFRDEQTGRSEVAQSIGVQFPTWDEDPDEVLVEAQSGVVFSSAPDVVEDSPYGRTYRLARRLRDQSSTPYDFARRVLRRVRDGASYSETPPQRLLPLDAFLFEDRLGYCQQFSGAMALLLRMGGIPARTVSGFSPGELDRDRREWVVRDTDAHAWVEAYFPRIGWVTFDPTPAEAPAASQDDDLGDETVTVQDSADEDKAAGDRLADPSGGAAAGDTGGSGGGGWVAPVGLLALALGATGLALWLRRREQRAHASPEARDLAELRRALRRSGRRPAPSTTLQFLERRLGGDAAQGYVRALRESRFGAPDRTVPATLAGRRALRRELGAGLGPLGRARAWWALPPRAPSAAVVRGAVRRVVRPRRGRSYTR